VNHDRLLDLLEDAADAVVGALEQVDDWGLVADGAHDGQHVSDVAADAAALAVLDAAGVGVLSEESGLHRPGAEVMVVIDPLDGSTNASRGIPWYATSLCAVDGDGPVAAVVVNLVSHDRFVATRGGGARRNGEPIHPRATTQLGDALIGLTGYPPRHLGWQQFRALGAIALDLCAVAAGLLDGCVDCVVDAHGSWDYLGGMLVCQEAGAVVAEAWDRELVAIDHGARRTPVAAATRELLTGLIEARRSFGAP
jgi:myo-inositol-1(or 4)-monophosphatase